MQAARRDDAAPLVLHMDLHMDAPVITMPRFSNSTDNIKVDLGSVHLSNQVAWRSGSSVSDPQVCTLASATALCHLQGDKDFA